MSSIHIVKEIPILSLRLQIQLQAYGIKLDTSKFETMIEEDNDISNVIKVCGDLLFSEEEDESDYDEDSVDSALTFDFDAFCNKMEDKTPEGGKKTNAIATMLEVGEQWTHGSVEVARGGAMTLMPTKNKKEERRKQIVSEVNKRQKKLGRKSSSLGLTPGMLDTSDRSEGSFTSGNVIVCGTSGEF